MKSGLASQHCRRRPVCSCVLILFEPGPPRRCILAETPSSPNATSWRVIPGIPLTAVRNLVACCCSGSKAWISQLGYSAFANRVHVPILAPTSKMTRGSSCRSKSSSSSESICPSSSDAATVPFSRLRRRRFSAHWPSGGAEQRDYRKALFSLLKPLRVRRHYAEVIAVHDKSEMPA